MTVKSSESARSAAAATAAERTGENAPGAAARSFPILERQRSSAALRGLRNRALPTAKYLLQTEVHTFAFSVAANVILSFFPFIVLLMTIIRRVFRSDQMYDVIIQLLRAYLPAGQEFIV